MYTGFAEIYDELMADVRYGDWADFYVRLLAQCGIQSGRICECACGTGSLTLPLHKRGFHMTGVDLSTDMLLIASGKARENGVAIPFVQQDMRELRLHRPMDAVLATCDGVNYLTTMDDVLSFFKSAYQALRPGGALVFDVSTPYKLTRQLGNRMICEDTEHITYVWQNTFHEKTRLVDLNLCIFVKEQSGLYRRIDEEQKQRAHTAQELIQLLLQAGFVQPSVYGNTRMEQPRETEHRWHFTAIKPKV